jgi:16S rRNA (cytidine1402-2'-O)-methyltransferase
MKPATLIGETIFNPYNHDCDPMDVLPEDRENYRFHLIHYIVENEKTAHKSIKVHPEKKQSELVLLF